MRFERRTGDLDISRETISGVNAEQLLRRLCGTDEVTGDRLAARILSTANRRSAAGAGPSESRGSRRRVRDHRWSERLRQDHLYQSLRRIAQANSRTENYRWEDGDRSWDRSRHGVPGFLPDALANRLQERDLRS